MRFMGLFEVVEEGDGEFGDSGGVFYSPAVVVLLGECEHRVQFLWSCGGYESFEECEDVLLEPEFGEPHRFIVLLGGLIARLPGGHLFGEDEVGGGHGSASADAP